MRVELTNTSSSSSSSYSTGIKQQRDVVVFPDSTIVAWGSGCVHEDCEAIADFLFGHNYPNSKDMKRSETFKSISSSSPEHIEIESIQYQLVGTNKEETSEIENISAGSSSGSEIESEKSDQRRAGGGIEVSDGVATIHGPFSNVNNHYNCHPVAGSTTSSSTTHQEASHLALEMLPVVMAVAQSARVDAIDNHVVSKLAYDVRHWQKELAFKGTLSQRFTLRDLRRSKAALLGVREELSFALEVEATPKLLRIANELKRFREGYDAVADHFELEQRLEALESRVEAIDESLGYLHDERHSVLSEQMTVLIVVLIALEIVVAAYEM